MWGGWGGGEWPAQLTERQGLTDIDWDRAGWVERTAAEWGREGVGPSGADRVGQADKV